MHNIPAHRRLVYPDLTGEDDNLADLICLMFFGQVEI